MATPIQRDHIVAVQRWLIAHNAQIGYIKHRPMATAKFYEQDLATMFAKGQTIETDCSETVTLVCRLAGLKPPSGPFYPYSGGEGNSTSMWEYLPHYDNPAGAHPGAIVAFGATGDEHVAMVMETAPDPLLFSHGSPSGPGEIRLSVLTQALGNPLVTMLDVSRL